MDRNDPRFTQLAESVGDMLTGVGCVVAVYRKFNLCIFANGDDIFLISLALLIRVFVDVSRD